MVGGVGGQGQVIFKSVCFATGNLMIEVFEVATSTSKGSLFNFLHVGHVYSHTAALCFTGHKQLTCAHAAIGPHTARISTKEGEELQALQNLWSSVFCIGSWMHFLCPNHRGFKKIALDLQQQPQSYEVKRNLTRGFCSHRCDTRMIRLLREGGHTWERIVKVSATHEDWVHRDVQLSLVL